MVKFLKKIETKIEVYLEANLYPKETKEIKVVHLKVVEAGYLLHNILKYN